MELEPLLSFTVYIIRLRLFYCLKESKTIMGFKLHLGKASDVKAQFKCFRSHEIYAVVKIESPHIHQTERCHRLSVNVHVVYWFKYNKIQGR